MNKNPAKKILVAEDDPGITELMKIALTGRGYKILTCADGYRVPGAVAKFGPDLIIMDLWLPGIDGQKLTKRLKTQPETKDIPIVIVSAQRRLSEVVKKFKADGHVSKPFDVNNLLNYVEKFLYPDRQF